MENDNEIIDSQNDTDTTENEEEIDLDLSDDQESNDKEDDVESLKKKVQTLEAQKNHWKKKATEVKQPEERKEAKPEVKKTSTKVDNLSPIDLYALIEAKVPKEDIEEVVKASKLLGKSITESLQDPIVIGVLKARDEFRKTADAVATKTTRSGQKQVSDSEIVARASKGDIPEAGSPEADKLFWARRGGKR